MSLRPDRASQGEAFAAPDEKFTSFESVFRDDLFAGHRIIVTGSGSGIGKHIAALFARHGASVAIK